MPVLVTCKIDEDLIKIESDKVKYRVFRHSRASNFDVNCLIWPGFKLIRDFKAVLVTCKFDEDPIKSEVAILRTTFSPLKVYGKFSSNSETNSLISPKLTLPRFYACPDCLQV